MDVAKRSRLVILGLDGLSLSLARDLAAKGHLPHLSRLVASEQARPMRAELPELSPVNWTSFFTGAGPEEHGVFGFVNLDPRSYRLHLTDATWVQCPTIFDRLGEMGLQSRVINLPNTYPARPIQGMLIAGFVAHDLEHAVHPKMLLPRLRDEGYKLEADTTRGSRDPEHLLGELHATLESRRRALDLLWPDLAWDLFVLVLTEIDRLGHFLLPALSDSENPLHSGCLEVMHHLDRLAGDLLERFDRLPEPKRLLVLADHGFVPLITEVDLNVWLRQRRMLRLFGSQESELDASVIHPESSAFALDPGRIYLHTRERFARGGLSAAQAKELRDSIRRDLLGLRYGGEPVFRDVLLGEELYPGSRHPMRPDLLCVPRPGFDCKAKFDRSELFGFFGRRGTHCAEDALFYDSLKESTTSVRDVGRIVLEHFQKPGQIMV